jgi:hypothetical protein
MDARADVFTRASNTTGLAGARNLAWYKSFMKTNTSTSMSRLADDELLAQVKHLVACERQATAGLIARLAELDARRLYLAEGCSSLFVYCTRVLHLSEHAAYGRITAARAVRRCGPVILERLAEGSVNLTAVGLLAAHLTPDNCRALLDAARHKSKRQVEELAARLHPQPPIPDSIRKLPTAKSEVAKSELASTDTLDARAADSLIPRGTATLELVSGTGNDVIAHDAMTVNEAAAAAPPRAKAGEGSRPAVITPLAPERYKVQFTASATTCEKLRLAQDLLRHRVPNGDLAAIVDLALSALLRDLAKKKLGAVTRPRAQRATLRGSRYIPAAVRRKVWRRDGGRCVFVANNGRRCGERGGLEFHHVWPHGTGGVPALDNIELRCRAHNQYEAELFYGASQAEARRKRRQLAHQSSPVVREESRSSKSPQVVREESPGSESAPMTSAEALRPESPSTVRVEPLELESPSIVGDESPRVESLPIVDEQSFGIEPPPMVCESGAVYWAWASRSHPSAWAPLRVAVATAIIATTRSGPSSREVCTQAGSGSTNSSPRSTVTAWPAMRTRSPS